MTNLELHFRFGDHKRHPDAEDLQRALTEIFCEAALGLPEGDLAEHPGCSLTFGKGDENKWTLLSVDVYRGGLAILAKYADQDDADPEYEYRRSPVDAAESLQLWNLMSHCAESELLARFKQQS